MHKLLKSGLHVADLSREQADKLVRGMVAAGEVRKKDASKLVDAVMRQSEQAAEYIARCVANEVSNQLAHHTQRLAELERRVEELTSQRPPEPDSDAVAPRRSRRTRRNAAPGEAVGASGVAPIATSNPNRTDR